MQYMSQAQNHFRQLYASFFKLRFLIASLVLYWTYIHVLLYSGELDPMIMTPTRDFAFADWLWTVSLSFNVITVLCITIRLWRKDSISFESRFILCGPLVMFVGICIILISSIPVVYFWEVLCFTGTACTGIGLGFVTMYLGFLLSRNSTKDTLFCLAVSAIGNPIACFILTAVDQWLLYLILALLPWAIVGLIQRAWKTICDDQDQGSSVQSSENLGAANGLSIKQFLIPLVILTFVIGFSLGVVHYVTFVDSAWSFEKYLYLLLAVFISGLLLLTIINRFTVKKSIFPLFLSTIIVAAGFLTFILPDINVNVTITVHSLGFYFFDYLIWALASTYAQKSGTISKMFMTVYSANQVGQLLGTSFGNWQLFDLTSQTAYTIMAAAMAYILLVIATAVLLNMSRSLSFSPTNRAKDILSLCQEIAHQYGLTPRETEIMCLIVKGRSRSYIAEECSISAETVKTHINRIYGKLKIHSKQELLTIVEKKEDLVNDN